MNLKKYLSVGHVVEDMNHLHGRYAPCQPGMIPRFDRRKLGAARSSAPVKGGRHIIFSSKSSTQTDRHPSIDFEAFSRSRQVAQPILDPASGEHSVTSRPNASRRGVTGVFKRAHAASGSPDSTREQVQTDLFEKIIPIEGSDLGEHTFQVGIERRQNLMPAGEDLPARAPSWWGRLSEQLSTWLRQG
jgi:hypothetical protein